MAKLNIAQVAAAAHIGGWTGERQIVDATAIALAESGGVTDAKGGPNSNGTFDWGLFQINDVHKPTAAQKTDPVANAQRAYKIWVEAGHSFKPWATYNSGSYKKKITDAQIAYGQIHADTSIEERLKKGDLSSPGFGSITDGSPLDKATDIGSALAASFAKATVNVGALALGIVLLILGVIILLRSPLANVGPGRLAKAAKTVKKVR
jgi:hypothetical protein